MSRGPAHPDRTPREHVDELVALVGESLAARGCVELIQGAHPDGLLHWLGGPAARRLVGLPDLGVHAYWPRVWGARGLLYCWDPVAGPTIVHGLSDPAWRVREMCAKVVLQREIADAAAILAELVDDEVPRVRFAALRALAAIGEGEHADLMRAAAEDDDPVVRRAAVTAIARLARRLDRPL